MKPNYSRYYEYHMPTDKLLAYYNSHLRGNDKLHGFIPATTISKGLDEYVDLPSDEQYKTSLRGVVTEINKLNRDIFFTSGEDGNVRLKTKYACALSIKQLRIIEYHQKQIREHLPKYNTHHSYYSMEMSYSQVPQEIFDRMRLSIDGIHREIENIKLMNLEDDFIKNAFPLLRDEVSNYYWIMGLDYTPVSQKVEDKAFGCFGHAFVIGIVLFLIWLMAQIMCN